MISLGYRKIFEFVKKLELFDILWFNDSPLILQIPVLALISYNIGYFFAPVWHPYSEAYSHTHLAMGPGLCCICVLNNAPLCLYGLSTLCSDKVSVIEYWCPLGLPYLDDVQDHKPMAGPYDQ